MPTKLHRYYGSGYLHFITTSCYQRSPLLSTPQNRDLFLEVMEQVRRRYRFVVVGYVVMPEHVHLLFSEPDRANPSVVMKVLKQSFSQRLLQNMRAAGRQRTSLWENAIAAGHVWQRRFYDFVVFTEKKRVEKLRYMHRNPRSCAICIAIRWRAAWYRRRNGGNGAAIVIMLLAKAGLC
jgi:putative transposase